MITSSRFVRYSRGQTTFRPWEHAPPRALVVLLSANCRSGARTPGRIVPPSARTLERVVLSGCVDHVWSSVPLLPKWLRSDYSVAILAQGNRSARRCLHSAASSAAASHELKARLCSNGTRHRTLDLFDTLEEDHVAASCQDTSLQFQEHEADVR